MLNMLQVTPEMWVQHVQKGELIFSGDDISTTNFQQGPQDSSPVQQAEAGICWDLPNDKELPESTKQGQIGPWCQTNWWSQRPD